MVFTSVIVYAALRLLDVPKDDPALVRARLQGRGQARRTSPVVTRPVAPGAAARAPERDEWLTELRARLARGDVPAALEALWWWFARSLSGAAAESSWTSRELLAHASRPELAPLAAALDRLLYGETRPSVEDVRRLADRVQAELT